MSGLWLLGPSRMLLLSLNCFQIANNLANMKVKAGFLQKGETKRGGMLLVRLHHIKLHETLLKRFLVQYIGEKSQNDLANRKVSVFFHEQETKKVGIVDGLFKAPEILGKDVICKNQYIQCGVIPEEEAICFEIY